MCLKLINGIEPQVATEDIVVYKFVESYPNSEKYQGKYFTPYRYCEVEIGNTYKSELLLAGEIIPVISFGLHSFGDYENCRKIASYYPSDNYHEHIVKCVIPKGSKYYMGEFETTPNCYASDCITYVEIIETLTN